jgi:hypothetical protein
MATEPRPYGRQPVALHDLRDRLAYHIERQLRENQATRDYASVGVKACWLRAEDSHSNYGWPDYRYAYVWIAPIHMSLRLCETIELIVAQEGGVIRTGRGGNEDSTADNPLRPFVYAVVDLKARQP